LVRTENITIVDDYLNKRKIRARAPSDYMKEFESVNQSIMTTMKTHLIDYFDKFGIWSDNYNDFLRARAEIVSSELKKRLIERRTDTLGQMIKTDDLEEEMATFE